ncbi:ATP-dependent nuclease [Sphingomonas sp. LT1P40]|uniref:ATP-dependent nuclease n=1 Tax=Alteristakelama amylovorans TaxID=3096166 RepID=UPI002FCA225E
MKLISARITGFQSFEDTGVIEFGGGINLIVGQNNAGKSALLRALLASIPDDRHRSPSEWRDTALPKPKTEFVISVAGREVVDAVLTTTTPLTIPTPNRGVDQIKYAEEILSRDAIELSVTREYGSQMTSDSYPSHRLFGYNGHGPQIAARARPQNGVLRIAPHNNSEDNLPQLLHGIWESQIFYFSAERFSFGEGAVEYTSRLNPNAANLAGVLNTLHSDRGDLFRRLVSHLTDIFSTVGNLSTRVSPANAQRLEIRVWPTIRQERVELSFPLQQSGTGVAQMIALLVAVMTMEETVIIIDEINSFLHPAAVKSLLRILRTEYSRHQYIISTHAPEVVGFSNPSTVHLVRRSGYKSTIDRLDTDDVSTFREVAAHLGVSMADVFAAERVIWVEGETEETLFPYLYRELVGALPSGTVFTAVVATGDFGAKKRDKGMVYQVYSRLSEAVATLPVRVVFGFDTELLSDQEKFDMKRDSGGRLHFLPRRHLECYLLEPDAIAELLVKKDPQTNIEGDELRDRLLTLARDSRFSIKDIDPELDSEPWLERVDAAKLLAALISEISEHRATFDKTRDGVELARLILERDPERLRPLISYISELVDDVVESEVAQAGTIAVA